MCHILYDGRTFFQCLHLKTWDLTMQTIIVAVALGINNAATVTVMKSDSTILDRYFSVIIDDTDFGYLSNRNVIKLFK